MKQWKWVVALVAAFALCGTASAQVSYALDDGVAENSIGIGAVDVDLIWLTTFPVAPGGEIITSISAAFSSPGDTRTGYDGTPISILLYQDADGGSPSNATLLSSTAGVMSAATTNTLVNFDIPDTTVTGNFVIGILGRDLTNVTPAGNGFPAALDQTDPDVAGRSFAGFQVGSSINENDLSTIPMAQFGAIEAFGFPGNWLLRADGIAVPEPTSMTLMGLAVAGYGARRWKKKK